MNVPQSFGGAGLFTLDYILLEEQIGHRKDIFVSSSFGKVYDLLFKWTAEQEQS